MVEKSEDAVALQESGIHALADERARGPPHGGIERIDQRPKRLHFLSQHGGHHRHSGFSRSGMVPTLRAATGRPLAMKSFLRTAIARSRELGYVATEMGFGFARGSFEDGPGSRIVKVVPSPGRLLTSTVPRCKATMVFTMARPSPVLASERAGSTR